MNLLYAIGSPAIAFMGYVLYGLWILYLNVVGRVPLSAGGLQFVTAAYI